MKEDKTKFELTYLVIPNYAYKDNRLNWTSARVYGFIHSYTNPFFFSDEHLGEMFDVHADTIKSAIASLKELGYIDTRHKSKPTGGRIRLCVDRRGENTPSEGAKTPLGVEKVEAPKGRKHPYKVFKDNNIKGKNFLNNQRTPNTTSGDNEELRAITQHWENVDSRKERKGKLLGQVKTVKSKATTFSGYENKRRGGVAEYDGNIL